VIGDELLEFASDFLKIGFEAAPAGGTANDSRLPLDFSMVWAASSCVHAA
jgi:hypothetical protein